MIVMGDTLVLIDGNTIASTALADIRRMEKDFRDRESFVAHVENGVFSRWLLDRCPAPLLKNRTTIPRPRVWPFTDISTPICAEVGKNVLLNNRILAMIHPG
jgi:hypothetical protein